jgi:hypothetical protein
VIKSEKRPEKEQKNELARCLESAIFVIILIALLSDCDKTRTGRASGSEAEENE